MAVQTGRGSGRTIVIKLGTSSIVDEKTHEPIFPILNVVVDTCCQLRKDGFNVVLVSSGAIGTGLRRMNMDRRPKHLPQVQAIAAIGQCRLMSQWDRLFHERGQPVAQILLTRNDIADRTQYQNAQATFTALFKMNVIPIVNENDTLAVTEIKFGDNDTLSAITAGMVQADYLFLMTDVDCLYDKNPRSNPDAKAIEVVESIEDLEADVSSAGSALGTGGMSTKIVAARYATSAGVTTVITRSSKPGNIPAIVSYIESQRSAHPSPRLHPTDDSSLAQTAVLNVAHTTSSRVPSRAPSRAPSRSSSPTQTAVAPLHTRFLPNPHPIRDRHFWLLYSLAPHGTIYIDEGAWVKMSGTSTRNLLPAGVVGVDGNFGQQEAVRVVVVQRYPTTDPAPHVHARANASGTSTPTSTPSSMPLAHHSSAKATVTWEEHNPAPKEVGRALVNYSAAEIRKIRGLKSTDIHEALGYADSSYVALRGNIAFYEDKKSRPATPALVDGGDGLD
ncbi:glutamate 5-kinase [Lophium mytilinum]|uniref:Glutamate 5-kinase n=1 Tax=Lophium mytilinum TaxID=390894 RepID=A0A6A6QAW7_9PEZI|nr:glutamate 5-kinase [Lophium mytilinum]